MAVPWDLANPIWGVLRWGGLGQRKFLWLGGWLVGLLASLPVVRFSGLAHLICQGRRNKVALGLGLLGGFASHSLEAQAFSL